MSRDKRNARELSEAADMSYQTSLQIVRGQIGLSPKSPDCLVLLASKARGWPLNVDYGRPCRCAECLGGEWSTAT